ncbi:sensor domain-containing diguanylate cyclase [Anaerobacillus alkaliphilus]|uniref:sensor domain-containing diguanylate cyclase n=1 Tax=Anaerobacillus alkaliphilus TaxID=1548597 RepID=UPI0013758FE3|nr:diguanylate cyclase [Anaerobacillus alkaliphilus]
MTTWILLSIVCILLVSHLVYWYKRKISPTEKRIFKLIEGAKDIVYVYEIKPVTKYRYISPSLDKYLGKGTVETNYRDFNDSFNRSHPDDYDTLVKKVQGQINYDEPLIIRWRDNDGNYHWFEEYATAIYNKKNEIVAIEGVMRCIDEKIKLQQELEYNSNHDALTNLYNRGYFEKLLETYDENEDTSIAIIVCDLDELKYINDQFGHKQGDSLIVNTAKLLSEYSSENVFISRIGGDEFSFVIVNHRIEEIELLLEKLYRWIAQHNEQNISKIQISIGHSYTESSIGNTERIFIEADRNMYTQKSNKKLLV